VGSSEGVVEGKLHPVICHGLLVAVSTGKGEVNFPRLDGTVCLPTGHPFSRNGIAADSPHVKVFVGLN